MTDEAEMKEVLDPKKLALPSRPLIEEIELEHYEDSSGEESLEIWVILDDSTKDEDLTGENVMQVKSAIREALLSNQVRLFPYIRFIVRAEYDSEVGSE